MKPGNFTKTGSEKLSFRAADGTKLESKEQGSLVFSSGGHQILITDVFVVENLQYNLLSVVELAKKGICFDSLKSELRFPDGDILKLQNTGRNYIL